MSNLLEKIATGVIDGKIEEVPELVRRCLDGGQDDSRQRPARRNERSGKALQDRRAVRSRSASVRQGHARQHGIASPDPGRGRRKIRRQAPHRHRGRRYARYRKEPGRHDVPRGRVRRGRSGVQRGAGEIHRGHQKAPARCRGLVRLADHDHAGHGPQDQGHRRGGPSGQGQGDGGGSAGAARTTT